MHKTKKKTFTAAQLVRVSDLSHVVGGVETDRTRQKELLVIEYKP